MLEPGRPARVIVSAEPLRPDERLALQPFGPISEVGSPAPQGRRRLFPGSPVLDVAEFGRLTRDRISSDRSSVLFVCMFQPTLQAAIVGLY